MNNKTLVFVLSGTVIAALAAAGFWHHDYQSLEATRSQLVLGELQPIAMLLRENQALVLELHSGLFTEKDSGIIESYLAKVRRDGVAQHAGMKQRLDTLAENNTAIVTLIRAYAPSAKAPAFTAEADKFRNYASAWRDRWNSVMELFMAGGNYAVSGVPLPNGVAAAVDAEMVLAKP